ncbi:uncharacterized protein [Dermacentor andersoni]|uniref:uncharacterized protein isoform X2 n=1 Tax=Dermacentor andersoni TaxID=34620 RepID=UPI002416F421|nr:mucin-19-like isoform X2 [Dermacentor andersoni]
MKRRAQRCQFMKSIISLVLLCTASLTNAGPRGRTNSGILYYVGGWYGDTGFGGGSANVWLPPSVKAPLAPAHAVDSEGLPVSKLTDQQNIPLEAGTGGLVGGSGAGKLGVARGPSVASVSSINVPDGTSRKTSRFQTPAGSTVVYPGGTASTQAKNTEGKGSSASSTKPTGSTNAVAESNSVARTRNIIHEKPLGWSASSQNIDVLRSHTTSGKTPVSAGVLSVGSGTGQSGSMRDHPSAHTKSQHIPPVNTAQSPATVGSTTFHAPRHLEASTSSRMPGTVGTLGRHLGLKRAHAFEGTIPASRITKASEAPSVYNTSVRENKRSDSFVGIVTSPSEGGSGIHYPSLAPGNTTGIRTATAGNSPSLSKAESAGNLLVGKTKAGPQRGSHDGFSATAITRNSIPLGTSESPAARGSGSSHSSRPFLGIVDKGVAETGAALRRQPILGNASESEKDLHARNSRRHFGSNSGPNFLLPLKQPNGFADGAAESASVVHSRTSNPLTGRRGPTSSVDSVRHTEGSHPNLQTKHGRARGMPVSSASRQPERSGKYHSFHESKPSGFTLSPTILPNEGGFKISHLSGYLGGKATPAITIARGALREHSSLAEAPGSGRFPSSSTGGTLQINGRYGPISYQNRPSGFNAHVSETAALGGSAGPSSGASGNHHFTGSKRNFSKQPLLNVAAESEGLPGGNARGQLGNNVAYGSFIDTSLPSGFSISSTGAPIGAGSDIFRSSERLGSFAGSRIVESGSTLAQTLGSRDYPERAAGSSASGARTQLQNSGLYRPKVLETKLSRFTVGTSNSPVAPLPSVPLKASPSSGNTRAVGTLANVAGLNGPPPSTPRTAAYGSFIDTNLPSGFSVTNPGTPVGAGSYVHSSKQLGDFLRSRIVGAGGTLAQPLNSRNSRENAGGSPASSGRIQLANNGLYRPQVLETKPSHFTVGTSNSPASPLPPAHIETSPSSRNARAVGALANVAGLNEPRPSATRNGAYGSFIDTSLPSGFSISNAGAPIGAGSDVFHSSKRFGGFGGSRIVRAGGTRGLPMRSSDSREGVGGSPASSTTTQVGNSGQYKPHVLERQPFHFTVGTSESPADFKTSLPFVHIETSSSGNAGGVDRLAEVPSLSKPPQSAVRTGAYGSFLPTSLPSDFSISSTGAAIKAGSDIFHSSERIGGSGVSGITETRGSLGHRFGSGETREHSGGFPASNVRRQLGSAGQYGSRVLGRPPYYYTIRTSEPPAASKTYHSSAHFEGPHNAGNAALLGPLATVGSLHEVPQSTRNILGRPIRPSATRGGYNFLSDSVGHGNLGTRGSPSDARNRIFNPPGHMGELAGPGFAEAASTMKFQPALAGTARHEGGFPTASERRRLQPVLSGNIANYGSRYPKMPNSEISIGPLMPMSPSIAVSKVSDFSNRRAGSGGSPVTRTGGAIEWPTNSDDRTRSEGGFSADSRKIQTEPTAAYEYYPINYPPSSKIGKPELPSGRATLFYRPERHLGEFRSSDLRRHHLRLFNGHGGVPELEGVTAGTWKKLSGESSGHEVLAPKSSTNDYTIGDARSVIERGDRTSKPAIRLSDTSGSQMTGSNRMIGQQPGFEEAYKRGGDLPTSGGRENSGSTGGDSFLFPKMVPSAFTTGITGSLNEAGSRISNVARHFRDSTGSAINTVGGNIRRQSVSANEPEFEEGSLGVSREQRVGTNGYAIVPHDRPYDTSVSTASSSNEVGSRIPDASDRLSANTGSGITQTGGTLGWKYGLDQPPVFAGGFTGRSTRGKLGSTGGYSSSVFRNEPIAFIDGSNESPNSEDSRNSIRNGRLRGFSSGFPGSYDFSKRSRVHSYHRENLARRFANVESFVGGRDNTVRNNDAGSLVSSELGPRRQTGYPINAELPHYDSSFAGNNGARRHDSSVSSQEATAWNRRNSLQSNGPFALSTSNL